MTSRLLNRVVAGTPTQEDPVQGLSNREVEVYEMIGQGLTIQQIAAACISVRRRSKPIGRRSSRSSTSAAAPN